MAHAWSGTVAELKAIAGAGILSQSISSGYRKFYGRPSPSQLIAWEASIPALLAVLEGPRFDQIGVIVELQMPVGGERADIVLLGGTHSQRMAMVVELKQWGGVTSVPETREVRVPGIGIHMHPSLQALNYAGKLHFFNAAAHQYQISSSAFLHNATNADKNELAQFVPAAWLEGAPLFVGNDTAQLAEEVATHLLPTDLSPVEPERFATAAFQQSQHLFSFLQAHAVDIAREAELALAHSGMGLTEEQARIKNEVVSAVGTQSAIDFIVNGGPGSGKTLLAVSLLLTAAEQKRSCLLALRNNRLQAILKQIFDKAYPGVSGFMLYFEPRQGKGIAQFEGHVDLLICDEAQRMESRIMPHVLPKADVSVVFLDESQRLNPPEQGTVHNFMEASRALGRSPLHRTLPTAIRCLGGEPYHQWIEDLLTQPSSLSERSIASRLWSQQYELALFNTIEDLLLALYQRQGLDSRVALVASFTESPGVPNNPSHPDNLRVGSPLTSGFDIYRASSVRIPWLMSATDYRSFWIGGSSNRLERIASIYGAQGFESDYVGVIWGRDLLYKNGNWVLGDPNHCYDRIDKLVTGRPPNHRWSPDALDLVVNRYRIFLTRGIKGTFIYCEDIETRAHLLCLS